MADYTYVIRDANLNIIRGFYTQEAVQTYREENEGENTEMWPTPWETTAVPMED